MAVTGSHPATDPDGTATGMSQAGPRLRETRLAQGLSLTTVAARAGVSKGFLSLAERGLTRVSVPTLLAICQALGITIGALFDYPTEQVVKRGAPVQMGGHGVEEYLLTSAQERHLQVMRSQVQAGGGSGGAYGLECDTVFCYLLSGQLTVWVGPERRDLQAGQSTTYPGRADHAWENPGPGAAEVLWVFAPPLPAGPGYKRPPSP